MKRDMDLVRKILLKCVDVPEGEYIPHPLEIDGYSSLAVGYHVHLIGEAGLADVTDVTVLVDPLPQASLNSVTWAGHDFAEAAHSPELWEKGKSMALKVGGVGIDVMVDILKALAKEQLKKLGLAI